MVNVSIRMFCSLSHISIRISARRPIEDRIQRSRQCELVVRRENGGSRTVGWASHAKWLTWIPATIAGGEMAAGMRCRKFQQESFPMSVAAQTLPRLQANLIGMGQRSCLNDPELEWLYSCRADMDPRPLSGFGKFRPKLSWLNGNANGFLSKLNTL